MAETILFLDDEQNVLNALRRVFKDEEHAAFFTTSPEEARARISGERVAVVVSDQRMPTLTGTQFLEEVKRISPETVRILLTGQADVAIAMEATTPPSIAAFVSFGSPALKEIAAAIGHDEELKWWSNALETSCAIDVVSGMAKPSAAASRNITSVESS